MKTTESVLIHVTFKVPRKVRDVLEQDAKQLGIALPKHVRNEMASIVPSLLCTLTGCDDRGQRERIMMEIPLTQGQVALIDASDAWALEHKWYAQRQRGGNFYAGRGVYENGRRCSTVWLHVQILGPKIGFIIDHRNGNTLDCRRENLRYATQSQNRANSRKRAGAGCHYHGVHFDKRRNRYIGKCCLDYKYYITPYFTTAEAAARARDELQVRLHGEFARLNFPHLPIVL